MAYVSVSMGLTAQGEVLNSSYWTSAPVDGMYTWAQFAEGNITPTEGTLDHTDLEFGDTTNGLVLDPNNINTLKVYYNGSEIAYYGLQTSTYGTQYILFFGIDEENHLGSFWIAQRRQVDRWGYTIAGGRLEAGQGTSILYNTELGYNWIKAVMPTLHNWVSVASISGKNGIISLAQIASGSINDGEPVSDAAATAFSDLPAECNVGEIIDDLLPYEESLVDVLVKYKVKGAVTGAFEYVKLVAKKGSIPKSIEDGDKVVDIDPSKKSKLVTGLDEGSKYYFVIFIKDSADQTAKSNEMWIITGEIPIPIDLRPYVDKLASTYAMYSDSVPEGYDIQYISYYDNYYYATTEYYYNSPSIMCLSGSFNSWGGRANDVYFIPQITLNIDYEDNVYKLTVTGRTEPPAYAKITADGRGGSHGLGDKNYAYQLNMSGSTPNWSIPALVSSVSYESFNSQTFNSLELALSYCTEHFRNVSLYVNGVPWLEKGST